MTSELLQAASDVLSNPNVKSWAAVLVPSAVSLGGWIWAGNRLVKTVDRFEKKQDDHEALDNVRFENIRVSNERHANLVQAKIDEGMESFDKVRIDFAGLKSSLEARMPERRNEQRIPPL